jgi:DNA replication protein DnaC
MDTLVHILNTQEISVVITSNKGFDGRAEILGDPLLATALLDRLTHKCQVLSFKDDSYRLSHHKQISLLFGK